MNKITSVNAREILSAGAYPTIETKVTLENGTSAVASVPFGTSAGEHEAYQLLDKDEERYDGRGVLSAVENVNVKIGPAIIGMDVEDQIEIDNNLISLDTTPQRKMLGGNSLLSVSLASARAASTALNIPLYKYIQETYKLDKEIKKLPGPMMVMIEGGLHADASSDFQEYMIAIINNQKVKEKVRAGIEIYHALGAILKKSGYSINVGLEGAYAPGGIQTNRQPLVFLADALKATGYDPEKDAGIAMDPAASEFYKDDVYQLKLEKKFCTPNELLEHYKDLVAKFPIISIEDGFGEDDWDAWTKANNELGGKIMVMGDDLTATHKERLQKAVEKNAINAILIKPNQAGTLTETMETILYAKENNIKVTVSHRGGGETTDTFIIDIAAAIQADFVKVGPSRGERVVKYNRLMEIAEELDL